MDQETFADVAFPDKGLDLTRAFGLQPVHSTSEGQNVRLFEHETERARGGSRQGLAPYIPAQVPVGAHLIQHLNSIVHPGGSALLGNVNFDPPVFASPTDNFPGMPVPGSPVADFLPFISVGPDGWGGGKPIRSGPLWVVRQGGTGVQPTRMVSTTYAGGLLTPILVWPDPAPIFVGTALGATQLNALAQDPFTNALVPGTFYYTPVSATVLPLGDHQPILVQFVPSDPAHYFGPIGRTAYIDVVKLQYIQSAVSGGSWNAAYFAGKDITAIVPGFDDVTNFLVGDLIIVIACSASSDGGNLGTFPDQIQPDGTYNGVFCGYQTGQGILQLCSDDGQHGGFTQAAEATAVVNGVTCRITMWFGITKRPWYNDGNIYTPLVSLVNRQNATTNSGDATGSGIMRFAALHYRGATSVKAGVSSSNGAIGSVLDSTTGVLAIANSKKLVIGAFFTANNATFTAASSWNKRAFTDYGTGTPNYELAIEDRFPVNSPTAATGTLSHPFDYFALGVAFKVL